MTERITVSATQTDDGPHMPSWMDEDAVTYAQAGVDTAEGARAVEAIKGVVHDTYRPEVVGDIGGFGGLFSIAAAKDMDDPLLVSGTDGVGTKLKVAQMAGKHDTVGIDLVAMCANDILATGAEPLFFLDYVAIGKLKAENVGFAMCCCLRYETGCVRAASQGRGSASVLVGDRKSTRLNSSHLKLSRMPSSA